MCVLPYTHILTVLLLDISYMYVCVHMYLPVCVYIGVYACGGQRLTLAGFLICSPVYIFKSFKVFLFMYLFIYLFLCVCGCTRMWQAMRVEVRGPLVEVGSPSTMWVPGIKLRLGDKRLYLLGHFVSPPPEFFKWGLSLTWISLLRLHWLSGSLKHCPISASSPWELQVPITPSHLYRVLGTGLSSSLC